MVRNADSSLVTSRNRPYLEKWKSGTNMFWYMTSDLYSMGYYRVSHAIFMTYKKSWNIS